MEKTNYKPLETKVFVIYTGGTIGMTEHDVKGTKVLKPTSDFFKRVSKLENFNDPKYTNKLSKNTYALSPRGNNRIIYEVFEYPKPKDSSNINTEDWNKMAECIQGKYNEFDGFVVVLGTDTMAYTSSALSFMFEKPCKPIVLTGSQIPMFDKDGTLRDDSDATDNLLGALYVAGRVAIQEVTLFFDKKLFRGNRVIKFVNNEMAAFQSPNFAPLLEVNDIEQLYDMDRSEQTPLKHKDITQFNKDYVGILKLFPGITVETVQEFIKGDMKGIVLETFGAGNAPTDKTNGLSIEDVLEKATKIGVLILNCTQCVKGVVTSNYETGKALLDVGVIPGKDITSEAALGKLHYVLSKPNLNKEELLKKDLRGEITEILTE